MVTGDHVGEEFAAEAEMGEGVEGKDTLKSVVRGGEDSGAVGETGVVD